MVTASPPTTIEELSLANLGAILRGDIWYPGVSMEQVRQRMRDILGEPSAPPRPEEIPDHEYYSVSNTLAGAIADSINANIKDYTVTADQLQKAGSMYDIAIGAEQAVTDKLSEARNKLKAAKEKALPDKEEIQTVYGEVKDYEKLLDKGAVARTEAQKSYEKLREIHQTYLGMLKLRDRVRQAAKEIDGKKTVSLKLTTAEQSVLEELRPDITRRLPKWKLFELKPEPAPAPPVEAVTFRPAMPIPRKRPVFSMGCNCKSFETVPELIEAMDFATRTAVRGANKHFTIKNDLKHSSISRGHLFEDYDMSLTKERPEDEIGVFLTDHIRGEQSGELTPQDGIWMSAHKTKCYCKGHEATLGDQKVRTATCYSFAPSEGETETYSERLGLMHIAWLGEVYGIIKELKEFPVELVKKYDKFVKQEEAPEKPLVVVKVKQKDGTVKKKEIRRADKNYNDRYIRWYGGEISKLMKKDKDGLAERERWNVIKHMQHEWENLFIAVSHRIPSCPIDLGKQFSEEEILREPEPIASELAEIEAELKKEGILEKLS